ncbi:MAG: vitamin K epoxide reductase family protein [Thermomicrobiales bacterium]
MPNPDRPRSSTGFPHILDTIQWLLVAVGTAVAIYLIYVHYQEIALVCGIGDCEKVQTSKYAEFAGIPIAWLGLALYVVIAALLAARQKRLIDADIVTVLLVGSTFAGTLAVGYLTYLEIWVIDAICQWCVTFAIVTVILFIVTALQLRETFAPSDEPTTGDSRP